MELEIIKVIILYSAFILFVTLTIFVTLFLIFQKRKTQMLIKEKENEIKFEETLRNSELEIKENALKNIAWELHDNVGQLLSLARLEINILLSSKTIEPNKLKEVSEIIGSSLQEIRTLSRTLNAEYINKIGLQESIKSELDRFNRLKFINAKMEIIGEPFEIINNDEIILFRMIQEFFSNTIKYAQATELNVNMNYSENELTICVKDNGKGFDVNQNIKGSGLLNMESRAKMINTKFNLESDQNGTRIKITYQKRN